MKKSARKSPSANSSTAKNSAIKDSLSRRIESRQARIAMIGLGYVGLPLAIEFARAGFGIIGVDTDSRRINALQQLLNLERLGPEDKKRPILEEFPFLAKDHALLRRAVQQGLWTMTGNYALCRSAEAAIICVPTPLDKHRQPDTSYIESAGQQLARVLKKGALVVLESTTYPGTTEEILKKCLETGGRKLGRDFYLAFSPERIDPGNPFPLAKIPKIVGGVEPVSGRLTRLLYQQVFSQVPAAANARTAEMAKLLENIFRNVNIALVNELAMLCRRMDIDIWEVVELAATKPYGFMAFKPGPGLGGHCIPIDPFYLTWKAHEYDFSTRFIELSGEINTNMPYYVVSRIEAALGSQGRALAGAKVFILGVTYKKDIADTRESPSLKLMEILAKRRAKVLYHDPFVPQLELDGQVLTATPLKRISQADCLVIVTDHSRYDFPDLVRQAKVVVDTRGVARQIAGARVFSL